MILEPTKGCTKCKEEKPLTEFSKNRNSSKGLRTRCKQCNHEYYLKNKEKMNETSRQWNLRNKEKASESHRQWHLRNKEKRNELNRQWYWRNKERHVAFNLISSAKSRAKKKGLDFDLDDYKDLLKARIDKMVCEVSGVPLYVNYKTGNAQNIDRSNSPSIDRIDSSKGYVYSNIRIVCFALNAFYNTWGEEAVQPIIDALIEKRKAA